MKLGLLHPFPYEALQIFFERRVVRRGCRVHAHKAGTGDHAGIHEQTIGCRCVREESDRSTDDFRRDRGRQTLHQGHARSGTRRNRGAGRFDGALQRAGARRNLRVLDARAGHRQHQRGRVAEVLDEVDRTGAVRQVADRIELQLDVVELLSGVRKTFDERHEHRGDARAGVRLDLFDLDVLGHLFFHPPRDQLLDLFGAGAWPRAQHECLPNRNVGVLALRHLDVAVDAPEDRADEQHPCDVSRFGEESRGVVRPLDETPGRCVVQTYTSSTVTFALVIVRKRCGRPRHRPAALRH